jgi:hypothetical protein
MVFLMVMCFLGFVYECGKGFERVVSLPLLIIIIAQRRPINNVKISYIFKGYIFLAQLNKALCEKSVDICLALAASNTRYYINK